MTAVRFHSVCDRCGKHAPEYESYLRCAECRADVCPECCVEYDPDPPGHALCKTCAMGGEAA